MNFPRRRLPLLLCVGVLGPDARRAQVDPEQCQLFQLGYNQSFQGLGPMAAYAYYYLNAPEPDNPCPGEAFRAAHLRAERSGGKANGPRC